MLFRSAHTGLAVDISFILGEGLMLGFLTGRLEIVWTRYLPMRGGGERGWPKEPPKTVLEFSPSPPHLPENEFTFRANGTREMKTKIIYIADNMFN